MRTDTLVKLGDVADLSGGYAFKSEQYTESGHFVLRTVNITDNFSITREGAAFISEEDAKNYGKFLLQANDTLFVMVAATLGKIGFVRPSDLPALLNQNMWVIRAKTDRIDPFYLHYRFRELSKIPLAWVSGSARSFLRRDDMRNLEFQLPPKAEQVRIGQLLKFLDDKIELNRRMNETLEAMAQAIFRDWFVDFGPVRRKMAGATDPSTILGGLLPPGPQATHLANLFPDRLGTDDFPVGWSLASIYSVADVIYGAPFASARFNTASVGRPLARIRDLPSHKGGQFTDETHKNEYLIQPGDIVVGMDGEFRSYLWQGDPTLMNQRICCFKPKQSEDRAFVWLSIQKDLSFFESTAIATTVIHLGKKDIDQFEIVLPPPQVRNAFYSLTNGLLDRMVLNGSEIRSLGQMRDYLLPRLMSGEVSVSKHQEEAA